MTARIFQTKQHSGYMYYKIMSISDILHYLFLFGIPAYLSLNSGFKENYCNRVGFVLIDRK